jgi:two-component system phosphate regulon response regulator PhoB
MSPSLLLIHADALTRRSMRAALSGLEAEISEASELELADIGSKDVVLIAWRALTPASDSFSWLKHRAATHATRIIVLADRDEYSAAVQSLDFGADDCVVLPIQGDDLLIRVRACLKRPIAPESSGDKLVAGPIVLDRRVHRVSVRDEDVDLAPTEFRLLAFLLENQGRVFSRNELLTRAWSTNVKAGHRTVDVHVRRLRRQLERFSCAEMIQTVRGFGYRLRTDDAASHG